MKFKNLEAMSTPEGLSDVEYARHILEEILGFPCKGNIDLMADCLRSIGKAKSLNPAKAHGYMVRAIRLAREQGIATDRMWFMSGEYMHMRPRKTSAEYGQKGLTEKEKAEIIAEQATPEWAEMSNQGRALLAKIAGKTMP
jgi:hypothetical protein